jgi:hypothetical protein
MRSTSSSSRRRSGTRSGKTLSALAIAVLGALPALLIASSARASGSLVVEDWTMGVLLAAFGSMLVLVTVLGKRLSHGLLASIRSRSNDHRNS